MQSSGRWGGGGGEEQGSPYTCASSLRQIYHSTASYATPRFVNDLQCGALPSSETWAACTLFLFIDSLYISYGQFYNKLHPIFVI